MTLPNFSNGLQWNIRLCKQSGEVCLDMDNPVQDIKILSLCKQSLPHKFAWLTISFKNQTLSLPPVKQVSSKLFQGTLHSNTGKKNFNHLELYEEQRGFPQNRKSYFLQLIFLLKPVDNLDKPSWEDQTYQLQIGRREKTLGQIPASVNQRNSTEVKSAVPIQASCGTTSQCVLQVYFQLFRAQLCLNIHNTHWN